MAAPLNGSHAWNINCWTGLEQRITDLFAKYVGAQSEIDRLAAVHSLVHGYKLGLIMTAEAFMGLDALDSGGEAL